MELKDQIRIAREAAGYTQTEFATVLKVSRQAVIWWEEGTHRPKSKRIAQLEDALKVRLDISERGNAMPLVANKPSPSVDPDILRLAVAISRLPKSQREAIVTLAFMGEKKSLVNRSQHQENPDRDSEKSELHNTPTFDRIEIDSPAVSAGEFDYTEKREKNAAAGITETRGKPGTHPLRKNTRTATN